MLKKIICFTDIIRSEVNGFGSELECHPKVDVGLALVCNFKGGGSTGQFGSFWESEVDVH